MENKVAQYRYKGHAEGGIYPTHAQLLSKAGKRHTLHVGQEVVNWLSTEFPHCVWTKHRNMLPGS